MRKDPVNPFSDIGRKPISAREARVSKKIGRSHTLLTAHRTLKQFLTPTGRARLISQTQKNQLWAHPEKVRKLAEKEFLRAMQFNQLQKPPPNRWVLLKRGPYAGPVSYTHLTLPTILLV